MTLLQGVMNAFVMFFARVIASVVTRSDDGRRSGGGMYFLVVIVLQIVLGILASLVTAWFSRHREFRADAGGAHLAGRERMLGALRRLAANRELVDTQPSGARHDEDQRPARVDGALLHAPAARTAASRRCRISDKDRGRSERTGPTRRAHHPHFHRHPRRASRRRLGRSWTAASISRTSSGVASSIWRDTFPAPSTPASVTTWLDRRPAPTAGIRCHRLRR